MFNKLTFGWAVILSVLVFGFSACDDDDDGPAPPVIGTITDIAVEDGRFTTLVSALTRTGLANNLDVPSGRFTVFAPTDDAFAAAGIDLGAVSDEDLADILRYHVISGGTIFRTDNIPEGATALNTINTEGPNSGGLVVNVERSGGSVTVNEANVVVADVEAVNGVIHAIDQVLIPPTITSVAVADGRFTSLVAALQRTGLDEVLNGNGNLTVFAPTDDAFAASGIDLSAVTDEELTALLQYHVIGASLPAGNIADGDNFVNSISATGPGGTTLSLLVNQTGGDVTVNGSSNVVIADIFTSNGIIHAVDEVLTQQSIADFAINAAALSTLETAVITAGLAGTLSGEGNFTVFAPTDMAFMDSGIDLGAVSNDDLEALLLYHVVGMGIAAGDIGDGDNFVPSLSATGPGDAALTLLVNQTGGAVTLNGSSSVAIADIFTTNGIVHVVSEVLTPQSIVDFATKAEALSTLAATLTPELVTTLSGDGPFTVFAPVNSAFADISATLATLTPEQVVSVLTYHVVANANVRSDGIPNQATTVNGELLEFSGENNTTINTGSDQEVGIDLVDIQGTNGVVHVIGTVLIPENL